MVVTGASNCMIQPMLPVDCFVSNHKGNMTAKANTAISIGSAASRKGQAAVDISHSIEQVIRKALEGVDTSGSSITAASTKTKSSHAAIIKSKTALVQHIDEVYKILKSQGFSQHHVERSLESLPLHSIAVGSALDWLLLHLDRHELPLQYAEQTPVYGAVSLLNKNDNASSEERTLSVNTDGHNQEEIEELRRQKALTEALEAAASAEKAKKVEEEQEKEKSAVRSWILQYAEACSDSDDFESDDDFLGADKNTNKRDNEVIEDWEIWGDPKEVERRRAERARSALPREDRLLLIATELSKTMQGASAAKASGDKAEQRMYGQMIGQLKKEMSELGVTENDLPTVATDNITRARPTTIDTKDTSTGSAEGSDVDEQEFDLFDSSTVETLETAHESDSRRRKRAKAMARAALKPWSAGPDGNHERGKKGAQKSPSVVQQSPKALLQQLCQKYGLDPPRYQKLKSGVGGERRPEDGGGEYRYSATISSGTASSKSSNRKKGFTGVFTPPLTVTVPHTDDGWAKIEDAQNAAATLALLSVTRVISLHFEHDILRGDDVFGHDQLWKQLIAPFNELWVMWSEEGLADHVLSTVQKDSEEAAATRTAFINKLIESKELERFDNLELSRQGDEGEEQRPVWADALKQRLLSRRGQINSTQLDAEKKASKNMLVALNAWRDSDEGRAWENDRGKLPAATLRAPLAACLESEDVIVISGETGSGKTTQIPQFILETETEAMRGGACNIICTQPRRVAAISVAERVATERGEPAPGEPGATVGYSVRLDSAITSSTRLLFCTTGILLRGLIGDPALSTVSHVVVDEVHERTIQGDFLIALLRDLVKYRREAGMPLKVVLMSATLDSGMLSNYFGGCSTLTVSGRTFPVQQFFLEDVMEMTGYILAPDSPAALRSNGGKKKGNREKYLNTAGARNRAAVRAGWGYDDEIDEILNPNYDESLYDGDYSVSVHRNMARMDEDRIDYDLLEDLVGYIHENQPSGAILVFLPGMSEISNLHRRLESSKKFSSCWVVPLHSTVTPADQRKAFRVPENPNTRKIVIATNIAETSLTIEDVVYVVDSGKVKERRHKAALSMSMLVEDWVSVASAKQRRGRAGRVREGICYGMYTRYRFEHKMQQYQTPEMSRVPLEELVLQIHLMRVSPSAATFTARVLQPPPPKAVDAALKVLIEVGALNEDERLTPMGYYLAQLPTDVRVGKLLILGALLGCLSPALTIAACLSHKSPFLSGFGGDGGGGDRTLKQAIAALCAKDSGTIAAGQQSDHLVMAAAVDGWLTLKRTENGKEMTKYAKKYCLGVQTLTMIEEMRGQFAAMLAEIGLLTSDGGHSRRRAWFDDHALDCNKYSKHPAVLKAVLFAALYPNMAVLDYESKTWHDGTGNVHIQPGSVLSDIDISRFERPFITYLEKVRTSRVFLRECTVVSPTALMLFGGAIETHHSIGKVVIDGWLTIKTPAKTAALVKQLREALEAHLRKRVGNKGRFSVKGSGGEGDGDTAGSRALIGAIVSLLDYEEATKNRYE